MKGNTMLLILPPLTRLRTDSMGWGPGLEPWEEALMDIPKLAAASGDFGQRHASRDAIGTRE